LKNLTGIYFIKSVTLPIDLRPIPAPVPIPANTKAPKTLAAKRTQHDLKIAPKTLLLFFFLLFSLSSAALS
jgi:hypothetical protein